MSDNYGSDEFLAIIRRQLDAGDWELAVRNLRSVADVADEWDISEMGAGELTDVAMVVGHLRAAADAIEERHQQ